VATDGLTAHTLSCAAGLACRSRSGAPVAAIELKQRDAICNRRDAVALALKVGSSAAGPKPGRTSFSVKLGCGLRARMVHASLATPRYASRSLNAVERPENCAATP
jgi:hypothetical protein